MSERQDGLAITILRMSLANPGKVKPEMVKKAEEHLISVFNPVTMVGYHEMTQKEYDQWQKGIKTLNKSTTAKS